MGRSFHPLASMSLPISTLRCSKCEYEQAVPPRPMRIQYLLPSGERLAWTRALGWCSTCRQVTDGESLPTPQAIGLKVNEAVELTRRRQLQERSLLDRLLGRPLPDAQAPRELTEATRIFSNRRTPARCFTCGSGAFEQLVTDDHRNVQTPLHTCGGFLSWDEPDMDGIRISRRLEVLTLDTEGNILLRSFL